MRPNYLLLNHASKQIAKIDSAISLCRFQLRTNSYTIWYSVLYKPHLRLDESLQLAKPWINYGFFRQPIRCFAGHNKWSKIRHKKGANDAARAKQHTKAARAIEVASRKCNGDLENFELQSAISLAKSVQLPKDRILAAVERGSTVGKGNANEMQVMRYDAQISLLHEDDLSYNVALILLTMTDNKNRTFGRLRGTLGKSGGELRPTGEHDWMFEQVGIVVVDCQPIYSEDEILEKVMECTIEIGVIEVEFVTEKDDNDVKVCKIVVTCIPSSLHAVVRALQEENFELGQFDIQYQLKDHEIHSVSSPSSKILQVIELLEDDEEVISVYHNAKLE